MVFKFIMNNEWTTCLKLPRICKNFEYKFVVNDYNDPSHQKEFWEPGENRIITKHLLLNGKKGEYFNCNSWLNYSTGVLVVSNNKIEAQSQFITWRKNDDNRFNSRDWLLENTCVNEITIED